jgi:hypothetical protein
MNALAAGHNAAVQMIDTSVVRVHQHGPCIADNNHQDMGRSRGGLTSKIHAVMANRLNIRGSRRAFRETRKDRPKGHKSRDALPQGNESKSHHFR